MIIDSSCYEDFQFESIIINYGGSLTIGFEEEFVKFFKVQN
jgi:hypothetical protein